eukprot:jgi/Botrbrau1/15058/Bobra.118_2s0006.1
MREYNSIYRYVSIIVGLTTIIQVSTSEHIWDDTHEPSVIFSARSVYDLYPQAQEGLQAPSAAEWPNSIGLPGDTNVQQAPQYALGDALSPGAGGTDKEYVEAGSSVTSYASTKIRGGDVRVASGTHKRAHQKSVQGAPAPEGKELFDNNSENGQAIGSIPDSKTTSSRLALTDPFGNPWPTAPPPITTKWIPPPPLEDLLKIAAPKVKATPISGGFVKPDGTHFVLDGKITFFAGTNAYYLPITDWLDDQALDTFFKVSVANGVNLTRIFFFINGKDQLQGKVQPQIGVFNETGLQRFDLILSMCNRYGIRAILAMANFEDWMGGMRWYVDQVLGQGYDKEMFYTDPRVKQAYMDYVKMLVNRRNTLTGVVYKDDPTIFSWELANEPHTTDGYELKRGLPPGEIVRKWVCEMSAYIKGLGVKQMISVGDEGYRVDGNPNPPHEWLNNGWKGASFSGNLACPAVSFGTLHIYAGNWGFPTSGPDNYTWLRDNFVRDRAMVAFGMNKPYILEEYGMAEGYLPSREPLLALLHEAVQDYGASGVLIWQTVFWQDGKGDSGAGFNFDWTTPGNGHQAVLDVIRVMNDKTAGKWKQPKDGGAYGPPGTGCPCTNTPPNNKTTCDALEAEGGCHSSLITRQGFLRFCHASCNSCPTCVDVQPPQYQTTPCNRLREQGLCNENWMLGGNYCALQCNRCQCWGVYPSPSPPPPQPSPTPSPTPSPGPKPSPPPPVKQCTDNPPPFAFLPCSSLAYFGCWYWPLTSVGVCDQSCERC